jgi:hypothetical protein
MSGKMSSKMSLVILALSMGLPALAKKGGNGNLSAATNAGFIAEATEHSIRRFLLFSDAAGADSVTGVQAALVSQDVVKVLLQTSSGAKEFSCQRFDDVSQGGTIVKKEVVCN